MAVAGSRGRSELRKWKDRDNLISPERKAVWSEPSNKLKPNNNNNNNVVVPLVYYLSRNGQLEHPHFMEIPLSSPDGLFLRDVINRLNILRGKGMASQYSWSSKRSYKNGYVWHDLEANDFIHPVHGGEYVLKGSEILETVLKSPETSSSSSTKNTLVGDSDFTAARNPRRNQSWGTIDLHEYKVYKAESARELLGSAAADASTQTEEKRRRKAAAAKAVAVGEAVDIEEQSITELNKDAERSSPSPSPPPPSDSSPETLESLMKADGRLLLGPLTVNQAGIVEEEEGNRGCPSGRMKASSVLMSLISCGSMSFRECEAKEHGVSLVSSRRNNNSQADQKLDNEDDDVDDDDDVVGIGGEEIESHASSSTSRFAKMGLEDKEYFSGSVILESDTKNKNKKKKEEFGNLKRSNSYNADR